MANMSYCRFQNTLGDLRDCANNISESAEKLGPDEHRARLELINLCADLLAELNYYVEAPEHNLVFTEEK
jgi:hypothetical protein